MLAQIGRWTARVLGTGVVLVFLFFAVGEGLPGPSQLNTRERLMFVGLGTMLAGLAAAWKWQGLGGLLAVAGAAMIGVVDRRALAAGPFLLGGVAGVLHLLCWMGRRSQAVAWVAAAALGLFLLLAANETFLTPPLMTPPFRPEAAMTGGWRAEVGSSEVRFTIHGDGSVSGEIGGAALTNGQILRNRSWFGQAMHWRTDYVIQGNIDGDRVSAPVWWRADGGEGRLYVGRSYRGRLILRPATSL